LLVSRGTPCGESGEGGVSPHPPQRPPGSGPSARCPVSAGTGSVSASPRRVPRRRVGETPAIRETPPLKFSPPPPAPAPKPCTQHPPRAGAGTRGGGAPAGTRRVPVPPQSSLPPGRGPLAGLGRGGHEGLPWHEAEMRMDTRQSSGGRRRRRRARGAGAGAGDGPCIPG